MNEPFRMIWAKVQANRTATCFYSWGIYGENEKQLILLEFTNYAAMDVTGFQGNAELKHLAGILQRSFSILQDTFCHFTESLQVKLQNQLKYTDFLIVSFCRN